MTVWALRKAASKRCKSKVKVRVSKTEFRKGNLGWISVPWKCSGNLSGVSDLPYNI